MIPLGPIAFLLLATVSVHAVNYFAIRNVSFEAPVLSAAWVALALLPLHALAAWGYSAYFGVGARSISYTGLTLISYGMNFIVALGIQALLPSLAPVRLAEWIGGALIVTGICVFLCRS